MTESTFRSMEPVGRLRRWQWWLVAGLLSGALGCAPQGEILDQAQSAWDQGDYRQAAARYEEYLKRNPEGERVAAARFSVANIYFYQLKQYEKAIQHYIHLIEDDPTFPEIDQVRQRLAECYVALEKRREAVNEYENLIAAAANPNDCRRFRLRIADLYYELNDLSQALAEYEKVLPGAPYDDLSERALLRVAGIRFLRDEFREAIPAYQQVAQQTKDPQIRRQARFSLADSYERMLQYDLAIETLEQTEPDADHPDYITRRIATVRENQRQRHLPADPTGFPKGR